MLPTSAGCYLMYDENNKIIYIGKAKNLKNRVSQYFLRAHDGKTGAMVSHVHHFETMITSSEKEALILEMNLIQKYHPRYNIVLMDDKHYPYIELHTNIKDPYISIARRTNNKKSKYFGPYPNSSSAYEVIDLINTLYPLRKCNHVPKNACLYYHMHQCLGPCINKVDNDDYEKICESIVNFLKGDNKDVILKLKEKIQKYSSEMDYENALECKKKLDSLLYVTEKQNVEFFDKIDRDFCAFYVNNNYVSITIFIYRNGLLIGKKNFVYELIGEVNEFIGNILYQYYANIPLPKEIIVSTQEILDELFDKIETNISISKAGKFHEVISLVSQNAKEYLENYFSYSSLKESNEEILTKLGNMLNIDIPIRIELFDNSHLQGTNAIGAMVCFINGEEQKKLNRTFNINSENKKDDFSSMKEVLTRRYTRLKDNNEIFPDLVIVDGGKIQIEAAKEIFSKIGVTIPICGLVKDEKHTTRGLLNSDLEEIEIDDNELFLFLTKMQNAVHRFAISTHIRKRSNSMFKSVFDDIKGIGDKRKTALIKQFPTINDLKRATLEELAQFLPKDVAIELFNKIKEK